MNLSRGWRPAVAGVLLIGGISLVSLSLTGAADTPPARRDAPTSTLGPLEPPDSIAGRLFSPTLGLRAAPVRVPLQLRIPSLEIDAEVLGVGVDDDRVMLAPMGAPDDPVWQQAFWYRGGGIPGEPGTATIAGHVSGGRGASVFARLGELSSGDRLAVRDTRTGRGIRFVVTETRIYPTSEASKPALLRRIFGAAAAAGRPPAPSADGRSYLTLITCAGDLVGSSYDRRLVVYAERITSP